MILKFNNLSKLGNVVHGISTREFGTMKNENNAPNRDNLNRFLGELNLSETGVCMHQTHGKDIKIVRSGDDQNVGDADGMITNLKNIPLCVLIADCLPVLFYDAQKKVIGIGHGGRRGIQKGILKNLIEKMISEFGSDPAFITVGIGPGIEKTCYEVDGNMMDIKQMAMDQLLEAGVLEENIEDIDICTKCSTDDLYSYRGGDGYERFVGVISLK